MSPLMLATVSIPSFLADGGDSPSDIDPTTGKGPEWGEAAPVGLLVIVLMCVAVYFLVKSMNRNLKKVPESFASGSADGVALVTVGATAPAGVDESGAAGGSAPTDASSGAPTDGGAAGSGKDSAPPTDSQ